MSKGKLTTEPFGEGSVVDAEYPNQVTRERTPEWICETNQKGLGKLVPSASPPGTCENGVPADPPVRSY